MHLIVMTGELSKDTLVWTMILTPQHRPCRITGPWWRPMLRRRAGWGEPVPSVGYGDLRGQHQQLREPDTVDRQRRGNLRPGLRPLHRTHCPVIIDCIPGPESSIPEGLPAQTTELVRQVGVASSAGGTDDVDLAIVAIRLRPSLFAR